ncbi:MAG: hypothetical protein UD936_04925, partial [Acutalibacteraceae bacterium]|nr:hypothetical protein [Acutalibacteraceae bacterium]
AIAGEEFRRVQALSECQRSISLFQENVNIYAKNAISIDLVDTTGVASLGPGSDINDAITWYRDKRNDIATPPELRLQDAEYDIDDNYIDIFIYRSGEMSYKIAKYDENPVNYTMPFKELVTFHNIKEINWVCKPSQGTYGSVIFDYVLTSPTDFELLYSKKPVVNTFDSAQYSKKRGSYSVMTGMVINNMDTSGIIGKYNLRMSEDTSGFASPDAYKGDLNFVVIRTVPREDK